MQAESKNGLDRIGGHMPTAPTTPAPAITPAPETESTNHPTLAAKFMRLASRAEDKELEFLNSLIDSCINNRGEFDIKESTFMHVTRAFGFYFPEPGDELDR